MSEKAAHSAPDAHGHGGHGHGGHGHAGDGHDDHHVHSRDHYVKVWAALLVLFAISVIGPVFEIKILTLLTAFGVAIVKASMVVKFFMHLDVEKRFVHYFLATSLVFMFLFFAGVAPDVMKHEGTNWKNVAAMETSARVEAESAAGGHGHEGGGEHGAAPAPEHGAEGGH
jgi:caa(3)-type oxidase subunit IV